LPLAMIMKPSSDANKAALPAQQHRNSFSGEDDFAAEDKTYLKSNVGGPRKDVASSSDHVSSSHSRRASFQRSAVQSRSGQAPPKKSRSLRDVIRDAERMSIQGLHERQPPSPRKSFEKSDSLHSVMLAVQGHFRDGHATMIQAVYRGHRVRKDGMIRRPPGGAASHVTHRRVSSEITMSDFEKSPEGDSFASIDSPSWSPRAKHHRYEESFFHNSTITAATSSVTDPSDREAQPGSFSTLFSHDAEQDLPMRMPFRKDTPPRQDVVSRSVGVYLKKSPSPDDEVSPNKSIGARFPDIARLDLNDVRREDSRPSFVSLPFLKQRKTARDSDEGIVSSRAYFAREDEPIKPPARTLSPYPPIPAVEKSGASKTRPNIGGDGAVDDKSAAKEA
jgi:hypothetical protein